MTERTAIIIIAAIVTSLGIISPHVTAPLRRLNEANETHVDWLFTTIPAFCSPINAINRPIPAGIIFLTQSGIAEKSFALTPVTVRSVNKTPSNKTKTNALAYDKPNVKHTVYTKNALRPIPEARPSGRFAINAIKNVPITAESAVAMYIAL